MKTLIVDCNIDQDSWGCEDLRRLTRTNGITSVVRRAPQGDLPVSPRGFDRIIVSGSKTSAFEDAPWISKLHDFVRSTLNENIPYLGVCFGHQTLARVLDGKSICRRAETPEFGWTKITILEDGSLLRGLPKTFYSFSAHFEEVSEAPKGFKLLASSEACAVQACQFDQKPVFGIQFHPEKDISGADHVFEQRKKAKSPETLLHPGKSKSLYDADIGKLIFKNFMEIG